MTKEKNLGAFPDPSANSIVKVSSAYGKQYAKAIMSQWGGLENNQGLFQKRQREFERNRDYAQGTQDTRIYKQILSSLDPSGNDGTLLNIDWSPVPIVPKFVKIVVNKILSRKPYPNVEAVDPVSRTEKEMRKAKVKAVIENKEFLKEMRSMGVALSEDIDAMPDTTEEAEIFLDTNIKIAAEIAAQIATNLTLEWNSFSDSTFRRAVEDLVVCGIAAIKRENDPNHGIVERYVDPSTLIHSYSEDPNMRDLVYAAEVRQMSILDLKRFAKDITEEDWAKIARTYQGKFGNDANKLNSMWYDPTTGKNSYGYDEFRVTVLDFEFLGLDQQVYEEKTSQYGNVGFYHKGDEYKMPTQSVFDRKPFYMDVMCTYGGLYVPNVDMLFKYGKKNNQPRNIHDLSRTTLSYSIVATNFRRMMPKSMVSSIVGFADQLQITHLKIQQAIAKAKPDGIMIDIEGLSNVSLGKGGDLSPLDLQDIYEQTGIMYYRSKNPEGGFQNPPIREINNTIRNINELIALYNHYLRMIRDATGINEVMDGSTPKGEQLVGVREQAMAAANNAIYDITHSSLVLFKRVCEDVIKCVQILPRESVLYKTYEKAIGKESMNTIKEFEKLPMYNFGVIVNTEMDDTDRLYLEQNIQASMAQGEIDLEDAIAIRRLRDIDQAERLLVVRRAKRIKRRQQEAQQNIQGQIEAQNAASAAKVQADAQIEQVKAQARLQVESELARLEMQKIQLEYQLKSQLEQIKGANAKEAANISASMKKELQDMQEERKDTRVSIQAAEQSKLISQRRGERGELDAPEDNQLDNLFQ
mgnify:FL=1|jgi:hypothetical protein